MFRKLLEEVNDSLEKEQDVPVEEAMETEEVLEDTANEGCDMDKKMDKEDEKEDEDEEKNESKSIVLAIKEGQISVVETVEGQKIVLRDYDSINESEEEYKEIVLAEGKIPDWENPDETKMINDLMESEEDKEAEKKPAEDK